MDLPWRLRLMLKRLQPNFRYVLWGAAMFLGVLLLIQALRLRQKIQKEVNLYVVEEHHEVVQYWHREILLKNMNKSGNIMIHIDGHSDMAPPNMFPGFPQSHWPTDKSKVSMLMQTNDAFIQAAAINGLLDHVIWITPSWDPTLGDAGYRKYEIDIGYRVIRNKITKQFCECIRQVQADGTNVAPQKCLYSMVDGTEGEYVPMDAEECSIRVKSYMTMEGITENLALDFLRRKPWIDTRPIMLDIDEDYFGVESGYNDLGKVNISVDLLEELNERIDGLICPNNGPEEVSADKMLKNYLVEFIKLCEFSDPMQHCQKATEYIRLALDKHIISSFDKDHAMFCAESASKAMYDMAQLLPSLKKLNLEQLSAIVHLGFCMTTSPATVGFDRQYAICTGVNIPGQTVVPLHTPDQTEMVTRMTNFNRLMDHMMKLDLKVVTVCRSVRDGYTPRHLANSIEDGILKYFRQKKKRDENGFNIIFDENLLGGIAGWDNRYKGVIS